MRYITGHDGASEDLVALFTDTFIASEGAAEGAAIGGLVRNMLATTPGDDLLVCSARDDDTTLGCIIFSRLVFDDDPRVAFILAPVAVRTSHQRKGIGQALLRFGLDEMRGRGVDVAFTYGDPAYYGKVGFEPITEETARAPLALSMPQGWLAQSLRENPFTPFKGPSRCVVALDSPDYW